MVNVKVAELLDVPVWMDKDSYAVKEEDAFGCKVMHRITPPDYYFVMDEVGGNISQKGDGNVLEVTYKCVR